ncbi:MAG: muramoyltetrapeptide carboxypeptidase [Pseudomonadota bacterium]|jgi:muramoyltetrapeptide carboxypeptidase
MTQSSRHIAVVAPSGYAADPEALTRATARLHAQGHQVHDFCSAYQKHQRFAASDADRVGQLHAAARHPEVEIVIALRGGYGLSRLLPAIDFDLLAASGKCFVGHSDFTALHLGLLAKTGAVSFAGPMICDDFSRPDISAFTESHFWQCLNGPINIDISASDNPSVDVQGKFWGGNLSMVAHLMGTPWMPEVDGGILFIEDINEHPYRIERMLLQLLHAGVLSRQKAVILGDFSGYRLSDYDHGYDFQAMLAFMRELLPVPVLQGLPFGHTRDKLTLPVGAACRLRSDPSGLQLAVSDYPILRTWP